MAREPDLIATPTNAPSESMHTFTNYRQLKGVKECYVMVKMEETNTSITFDVVFRVRSDVVFTARFPSFSELDLSKALFHGDKFWMVPRNMADAIFNMVDKVPFYGTGEEQLRSVYNRRGCSPKCNSSVLHPIVQPTGGLM